MLKLVTVLGLLTISCSSFAATREADFNSLMMVNSAKQNCPAEFAEALDGRAIFSIVENDNDMQMESGYPAVSLNSHKQTTHRLHIELKPSSMPSPTGAPRFDVSCRLERLN